MFTIENGVYRIYNLLTEAHKKIVSLLHNQKSRVRCILMMLSYYERNKIDMLEVEYIMTGIIIQYTHRTHVRRTK